MASRKRIIATLVAAALSVGAMLASPVQAIAKTAQETTQAVITTVTKAEVWKSIGSSAKAAIAWLLEPLHPWLQRIAVMHLDTAYQTQYRQEFIAGYEQHVSLLRETVTTEAMIQGNQAIFLVADSGSAAAVTRGINGLIPARSDNNTQNTCTLQEWHDLVRKTGFNVFASQGNQRQIMQMTSMGVLNRKIDDQIITELNTGTVTIGSSTSIPDVSLFQNGRVKLSNASVPWDSNITLLCQPSFLAYLEQAPEFTNAQYVDIRPYAGNEASWRDKPMVYRWRNALVVEHPNLPGKATTSEKSFLFHKTAIGHAANTGGLKTPVGYNEEQDYTWARATMFMGAKLMQNSGVVVITHDGSAYA